MGYQVEAILTNGRKVSEVFGSNNNQFLDIITEYEEYDLLLEDKFDLSTGELSSKVLMGNLIAGDTQNLYSHLLLDKGNTKWGTCTLGVVYGYLHRDMCLYYGKTINRNTDGWPMFTQYLSDFEPRTRWYFKTPRPLDFPHMFLVLVRELEEYEKLYLGAIKEKFPNNADLEADIRYVFDRARDENYNIVFCNS